MGEVMGAAEDFDMEATLRILEAASGQYPRGSKEESAFQLAAVALLYVRHIKKLEDFFGYFREFQDSSIEVPVVQTFASQEEADTWLARGSASEGDLVSIAGLGFQVIKLPAGLRFLRTPLPDELGPPGSK
ncbi:hypothetical protein P2318_01685 [Myxococcaceae bacterium GXIMD 01537]